MCSRVREMFGHCDIRMCGELYIYTRTMTRNHGATLSEECGVYFDKHVWWLMYKYSVEAHVNKQINISSFSLHSQAKTGY